MVESLDIKAEECSTPGTTREGSPEIYTPTDGLCDGTDTYHYMEPDPGMTSEQPNPSLTNSRSTTHKLRHNPKPNCNDDHTKLSTYSICPTKRIHTLSRNPRNVLRNRYVEVQKALATYLWTLLANTHLKLSTICLKTRPLILNSHLYRGQTYTNYGFKLDNVKIYNTKTDSS